MEVFKIQIQRTKGGKKVIEEKDVPVDVGTTGQGSAEALSEADTNLRRLLGLPITKDLVYYSSVREECKKSVDKFVIDQIFTITEPWFILTLFMGEETVRIHHRYFSEMQSPTFVSDMNNAITEE